MTEVEKKQSFIGSVLVGAVVDKALGKVIDKALDTVAKSPSFDTSKDEAHDISVLIKEAVEKEVKSRVDFQNNQEAALKSGTIVGGGGAVIIAIGQIYMILQDWIVTAEEQNVLIAAAGIVVTAGFAVWRRIFAKKPIGE